MTSLTHCIYASLSASGFEEQELPQLLTRARSANALHGITGMLLYIRGTFFQVLEGEAADVDAMYQKILRDPRHTQVRQIVREPIAARNFAEWTMAFDTVDPVDAGGMIGDTDFFSDSSCIERMDAGRAKKLLAASERAAMKQELARHRHHLEELVGERTVALEKANEAAAAAHRASLERLDAERDARIQAGKLEAMGTLAAGIGHDFNNILASIVSYAEMTDDELVEGSEAKNNLAQVINGCFRARDLVSRMLDFARFRSGDPVQVDIVLQVREALVLLRASLRPSIELVFHCSIPEATVTIMADPTQIMQLVMNLCINAAHAMDNHGVIVIRIDLAAAIKDAPADQRGGICITVADNGTGMTPEVMQRIFDPFFTTKAPGEGSGLGLSVVYGAVKGLGGDIKVRSSAALGSAGTQFQVFLPTPRADPVPL
jgi:signal transduction histidine kinase